MLLCSLVTRGTYEMEMFHRASVKLGLDKAILHSMTKKVTCTLCVLPAFGARVLVMRVQSLWFDKSLQLD